MDLLLIRHGIAELRADEGGTQPDDSLRELTPKGQRRMKRAAEGLKASHGSIDTLATSPLLRARQTAEIVGRAYGDLAIRTVPELAPDATVASVVRWLRTLETTGTTALVGHEPALSALAAYLVTTAERPPFCFGKGGAALVDVPAGVPAAGCDLIWLATPRQLRRLGGEAD